MLSEKGAFSMRETDNKSAVTSATPQEGNALDASWNFLTEMIKTVAQFFSQADKSLLTQIANVLVKAGMCYVHDPQAIAAVEASKKMRQAATTPGQPSTKPSARS